jgi:hypothetical protein
MKKILFLFCLVISFIFTSCENMNVTRGDYMIVRQIRYPRNDNTVEYIVNGYTESGEYIDQIIIRDKANKYQINDTLILVKKCAYSH